MALEAMFLFVHISFLKKTVSHLVDIYISKMVDTKKVDERGRNFMCERTLLSLFVSF